MKTKPQVELSSERLLSLDVLRGFDMFWIVGGAQLVSSLAKDTGWRWLDRVTAELEHPEWHGFTLYDLIFPLFMFIAGVSFAFSLSKRRERGDSETDLHWHVVRRGLFLVLLGVVYNNGLFVADFSDHRFGSVLGRIGLGTMFGGLIAMHASWRGLISWSVGILLGYWAILKLVPIPEFGAGDLAPGHTVVGYVDRLLMPGHLYQVVRDPEGLLSTLPSIVNVLAGVMTGLWLQKSGKAKSRTAGMMALAGMAALWVGKGWDFVLPVNKNLWTSSFVLVTVGWSLLLLAFFYLVVDVWKLRKWTLPLVVIGANPLAIYMAVRFIDFQAIAELVLGDAASRLHPTLVGSAGFGLAWLILYLMYRNRIFWRV